MKNNPRDNNTSSPAGSTESPRDVDGPTLICWVFWTDEAYGRHWGPLLLTVNQPLGVIVPSPQVRRLIHRSCGGGVRPVLDIGNTRGPLGSLLFPGIASVRRLAGDVHVAIRAVRVSAAALFMWFAALLSHG